MKIKNLAIALLLTLASQLAHAVPIVVDAQTNSAMRMCGACVVTGASTGIYLEAGDWFSVTADADDLWSAGANPRWSNADGLTGDQFATGSDESGETAGTKIGMDFGLLEGIPYGSLVGYIDSFFLIGTDFSGYASAAGELLLFYWDSNGFDNSGSIIANVTHRPAQVPEPSTFILMLAGLGALGLMRRISA